MHMRVDASRAIATCRMGLALAAAFNAFEATAVLLAAGSGKLAMPTWVGITVPPAIAISWSLFALFFATCLFLGAAPRMSALALASLNVAALLADQQVYTNHFWLATLLVAVLAAAPRHQRWPWSRSEGQHDGQQSGVLLLMGVQLSACYLFGALAKVNEWWLAGDVLRESIRLDLPEWAYVPMAVVVILTEMAIATGMWLGPARVAALGLGVALHLAIVAIMHEPLVLASFAVTCWAVYPVVLTLPTLGEVRTFRRARVGESQFLSRSTR